MNTKQREALAVVIDAADKWSQELGEYIVPGCADDAEQAAQYQAEQDDVNAALVTLAGVESI